MEAEENIACIDGIKVFMIPAHPPRLSQDTMIRKTTDKNPNDAQRWERMESKWYQLFRGTRTKLAGSCRLRKNVGDRETQQWVSLVLRISGRNPDWDTQLTSILVPEYYTNHSDTHMGVCGYAGIKVLAR